MSGNRDKPSDSHPLYALLRQMDKASDLVVRAYEDREAALGEGDARRAERLIKGQILRLNSTRDGVSLSPDIRKAFDNALRPHRIGLINTDLRGHVELAVETVESLRAARRSQDLDQLELTESDLQGCFDDIYDLLDDGSRLAERQVHDNVGTQTDLSQRRRMNELYHRRLNKLTDEYHLVAQQLKESPFDSDAWVVQRVVDLLLRTIPVIERINLANRAITAWLHKDRQREERALKIRAVLAKFRADPGYFPEKAAARAADCPGVNRISPLKTRAAPDLRPNANTTLYAEDVAELAAKLNVTPPPAKRGRSEFAGDGNIQKHVAPPEGQVHFDALVQLALAERTPVSARDYWGRIQGDPALSGWNVATFLYALNAHLMDGAFTADGEPLETDVSQRLITRAVHPLSGTERLYDVVVYPSKLPREHLPAAVHYERIATHAQ